MLERAQQMLAWPIQEETVTDKTEITEDGQKLIIHQRIIRPVKWDFNALARFIETMDRIARSSVIDATKGQEPEGIPPGDIAERHFILYTAEQVQMPVVPEQPAIDAPKDNDWIVDAEVEGVYEPLEPRIPH